MEKINLETPNCPSLSLPFSSLCLTPTISKILSVSKKVFLSYGVLIINGSLSIYHLFRAYQFKWHTNPFLLEDHLKIVACKILLKQIYETDSENVKSLCQKFKALCESLGKNSSNEKEKLLFDLSVYYVEKKNLNECLLIAEKLSDANHLLNLAKIIRQNHLSSPNLLNLYNKAFQGLNNEKTFGQEYLILKSYLELAERFHYLGDGISKTECIQKAMGIYNWFTYSKRLYVCFTIAQFYQQINDQESLEKYIESLPVLDNFNEINKNKPILNLITASFWPYLVYKKHEKLDQIKDYLQNNPNPIEQDINSIFNFIKKLKGSWEKKYPHTPETALENILNYFFPDYYASYLKKTHEIKDISEKVNACIALIGYCISNNKKDIKSNLDLALEQIAKLPESSSEEIYKKFDLISRLIDLDCFVPENENKKLELMQKLEDLFDKYSDERKQERLSEGINLTDLMGHEILQLYKKSGKDANTFFSKFLQKREMKEENENSKIISYSLLAKQKVYSFEQKKELLEKAEKLLSNVSDIHYHRMASLIADSYLEIDSQKSVEIIKQYENYKGESSLYNSAIYLFLIGASYFTNNLIDRMARIKV